MVTYLKQVLFSVEINRTMYIIVKATITHIKVSIPLMCELFHLLNFSLIKKIVPMLFIVLPSKLYPYYINGYTNYLQFKSLTNKISTQLLHMVRDVNV